MMIISMIQIYVHILKNNFTVAAESQDSNQNNKKFHNGDNNNNFGN